MLIKTYDGYPYILIYTDMIPENFAGCINGFVIRIRPKYKNDTGLFHHEASHLKWFWKHFPLHGLLNTFIQHYRCENEIAAYREQLKYNPEHIDKYVQFIVEKYGLDVRIEYIKLRLAEA